MPAYLIADVDVPDADAYRASGYVEAVPKLAATFGGRYIVRGGTVTELEGGWSPARLVVIEFPDMERLRAFYDSDEYRPYLEIRTRLSRSRVVAVEGLDTPPA